MRASLHTVVGAPPPPVRVGCLYYIGKGQALLTLDRGGVYKAESLPLVGDQIQGGAL